MRELTRITHRPCQAQGFLINGLGQVLDVHIAVEGIGGSALDQTCRHAGRVAGMSHSLVTRIPKVEESAIIQ